MRSLLQVRRDAGTVVLLIAAVVALGGCSAVPRIQIADDLVLGCPSPLSPNEPPITIEGPGAVLALVEAMTLCDDELIAHPDDAEFQERLKLQEKLEKMERRRAKQEASALLAIERQARPEPLPDVLGPPW